MSPEEMMLNLLCLDKGIVQLSDLESIKKQFEALPPSERRKASRKIRKLAKKFIKSTSFEVHRERKMHAAGFGFEDPPRSSFHKERYNKIKALYARRLLVSLIRTENEC